jgi:uncharacterized protein YjcR
MAWNAKKQQYLQMLCDPFCRLSQKDMAKKLGVSTCTLRNWKRGEQFRRAQTEYRARMQEDNEWAALKEVLYEKAMGGDVPAAKLVLQMREMNLNLGGNHGITLEEALFLIGNHLGSDPKPSTRDVSRS